MPYYSLLNAPLGRAAQRRADADVGLLPGRPVAGHPFELRGTQSDTGQYQRSRHRIFEAVIELRVVYGNYWIGVGDQDTGNAITVKASIESPLSTYWPISFSGEDVNGYVTLRPGRFIVSDPISIPLAAGTDIWINTMVAPTGGTGLYPVGGSLSTGTGSSEWRLPATTTDYTVTAPSGTNTAGPGYGPLAIIGRSVVDQPVVALIGDSIVAGSGDDSFTPWGLGENGWARRALNNTTPYVFLGRSATLARDFPSRGSRHSLKLVNRCTHALVTFGANDLTAGRTLAQLQADLTSVWRSLVDRGISVYQTTITPNTASTDAWGTTTNQTPVASNAVRVQLNDWLRTTPALLSGYAETADTVESARNSGLWKPNLTADGLHPNAAGHVAMGAAMPSFRLPS